MADKAVYGFPDEDRKEIVYEFDNNDSSRKRLPSGRWGRKFNVQDIHDQGGIPYIEPEVSELEKISDELLIDADDYTRKVVLLTQGELDELTQKKRGIMSCTLWQFRKAINATGKRGAVQSYLSTANQDVQDGWEVASSVERMHPNIDGMKDHFNMTDDDMDALFILAATL